VRAFEEVEQRVDVFQSHHTVEVLTEGNLIQNLRSGITFIAVVEDTCAWVSSQLYPTNLVRQHDPESCTEAATVPSEKKKSSLGPHSYALTGQTQSTENATGKVQGGGGGGSGGGGGGSDFVPGRGPQKRFRDLLSLFPSLETAHSSILRLSHRSLLTLWAEVSACWLCCCANSPACSVAFICGYSPLPYVSVGTLPLRFSYERNGDHIVQRQLWQFCGQCS
jgi:hypothetical protein